MARCVVCGGEYAKSMEIRLNGVTGTYDCFECAIHALAPACEHCGCRVIGHGVEATGRIFCCTHCDMHERRDDMARTRRRAGANRSAGSKRASNTRSRRVKASGTKSTKRQPPAKHSSKRSSRANRPRVAVGSRGPRGGGEAAIVLIGAVPAASLEEPESELQRARRDAQSMVGDELPGGTVAMPEQDNVDEFAEALGVERSPGAPLRGSAEILDRRDQRRRGRKPSPSL